MWSNILTSSRRHNEFDNIAFPPRTNGRQLEFLWYVLHDLIWNLRPNVHFWPLIPTLYRALFFATWGQDLILLQINIIFIIYFTGTRKKEWVSQIFANLSFRNLLAECPVLASCCDYSHVTCPLVAKWWTAIGIFFSYFLLSWAWTFELSPRFSIKKCTNETLPFTFQNVFSQTIFSCQIVDEKYFRALLPNSCVSRMFLSAFRTGAIISKENVL